MFIRRIVLLAALLFSCATFSSIAGADEAVPELPRFSLNGNPVVLTVQDLSGLGTRPLRLLVERNNRAHKDALMSDPNKDLGKWILRDVLQVPHGEILTYSKLEEAGVDSVVISKISPLKYEMDFRPLNSFEEFSSKYLD